MSEVVFLKLREVHYANGKPEIREVEVNASWIGKITPFNNNELRKKLALLDAAELYELVIQDGAKHYPMKVIGHRFNSTKTLLKG